MGRTIARTLGAALLLLGIAGCESFKPMPPPANMMTEATAWCVKSPEPARCRGRSGLEHPMCAGKGEQFYEGCRFALDQMHGP